MQGRGRWIQMASGRLYYPWAPLPEDVDIEDIAHHLGNLCRFTGACRQFYSVAEHSVLVSYLVPEEDALCGLLHDATEAYLNDLSSPVKSFEEMSGYRTLERRNWGAVARRFDLPFEMPKSVHDADQAIYFAEREVLMPPLPPEVVDMYRKVPVVPRVTIVGYSPEVARWRFLQRYRELTRVAA